MKTLRNLAFLTLVAVMFAVDREGVLASSLTPPVNNCPYGCTCTVTWNNWLEVTGDCPEEAPINVCTYVYNACDDYCSELSPYMDELYPQYSHACGYYELLGSCEGPYGLEPPTEEWICGCYCWQT